MQILRQLAGSSSSKVELVLRGGKEWILKTAEPEEILAERRFQKLLTDAGLAHLETSGLGLASNQLFIEYVPNSPTLSNSHDTDMIEKWGQLVSAMHAIHRSAAMTIEEDGQLQPIKWSEFIRSEIDRAAERQNNRNTGLEEKELSVFLAAVNPLAEVVPPSFSLLHADLHSNNVLIRKNEPVLFDNGSGIMFGDPLYDLATVVLNYSNELIITGAPTTSASLSAFVAGYGRNFLKDQELMTVMQYAILRGVIQYPNPFLPHLKVALQKILTLLQA